MRGSVWEQGTERARQRARKIGQDITGERKGVQGGLGREGGREVGGGGGRERQGGRGSKGGANAERARAPPPPRYNPLGAG